ncbi:MAG: SGNH/GDSL hydrolase family protein [Candidatus Methylacidiphilales bacterium]|nr:SGNH/GDSL hydrolase family protein [Candidatus Methylacidiphilales bacterium]
MKISTTFRATFMALAFSAAALLPVSTTHAQDAKAAQKLKDGDLVAICGDSITAQQLYSLFMADYLLMCQPAANLQGFQAGWGGESAGGFFKRMKTNVLDLSPTVATTCYGMNDGGYGPTSPGNVASYKKNILAIVKAFKEGGVRFIVVGTPGAVDTTSFKRPNATPDVYNITLGNLGKAAKEVAESEGVGFADVHGTMLEVMARAKEKKGDDYLVGGNDGVHPGANGHLVMAYAFLKGLGCDGNIGTITIDMKAGSAEATSGHKVLNSNDKKTEIQSTRYPFCFPEKSQAGAAASILDVLPFNQDLNRYMLVVKNTPDGAANIKVTWGDKSKVFPVADLARGINLAAEFPDNPFCEPFAKVQRELAEQQNAEAVGIKDLINSGGAWSKLLAGDPEVEGLVKQLVGKIPTRLKAIREATSANVQPVTHTISLDVAP